MDNQFIGEAGGGLVKITLDYRGIAVKVEIDDEIFKSDDKDFISDLFVCALNDATNKMLEAAKDRIKSYYPQ